MSHLFRFLGLKQSDLQWQLHEDERIHATKVLRLKEGTPIEIGDGKGSVATALWTQASAKVGIVEGTTTTYTEPPERKLTLCLAALKHHELDDLIAPLSETGVDQLLVFLRAQDEKSRIATKAVERWEKLALKSIKQCKRPWSMHIKTFPNIDQLCAALSQDDCRLVMMPGADQTLLSAPLSANHGVTVLIGNEAGLNSNELALLTENYNFTPTRLGVEILRATTCAVLSSGYLKLRLQQN